MGLKLDGIAASSAVDTSGEVIEIDGMDISSLQAGEGTYIYEHRNAKSPGASAVDVVGSVNFAKKIFSAEDCDDDRQKFYWDYCQVPFIYARGELFDDEDHEGAKAVAAVIDYYKSRNMPILVRFSIDGHTIKRGDGAEKNVIKRAIARDVALTIRPCNKSCISGVIDDKPIVVSREDLDKFERPLSAVEFVMAPMSTDADPIQIIKDELEYLKEMQEIQKAVSLGNADVAPSELRGASALGREDLVLVKNKLKAAVRDWDGKQSLTEHLSKRLPDANPEFIQKFAGLIDDYRLYKAQALHGALDAALAGGLQKAVETGVKALPSFDADKTGVIAPKLSVVPKPPKDRTQMMADINADAARSNHAAAHLQSLKTPATMPTDLKQLAHLQNWQGGTSQHIDHNQIAAINGAIAANFPAAAALHNAKPHHVAGDFTSAIAKLPQVYNTRESADVETHPTKKLGKSEALDYAGTLVHPGAMQFLEGTSHPWSGMQVHILDEQPDHFVVADPSLKGTSQVPKAHESKQFQVLSRPAAHTDDAIVTTNDIPELYREAATFVIGSNLSSLVQMRSPEGFADSAPSFLTTPAGTKVVVTPPNHAPIFYKIANECFGLGAYVLKAVPFKTGTDDAVAQELAPPEFKFGFDPSKSGTLDTIAPKLAVLDFVLGNQVRNSISFVVGPDANVPDVRLVTNAALFKFPASGINVVPAYAPWARQGSSPWSAEILTWIASLNVNALAASLTSLGCAVPAPNVTSRLELLQSSIAAGRPISYEFLRCTGANSDL